MLDNEKLSDDFLDVMKFAATTALAQLAMFGAFGGEQFYAAMREGAYTDVDKAKTEKVIGALKAIAEVMGEGWVPLKPSGCGDCGGSGIVVITSNAGQFAEACNGCGGTGIVTTARNGMEVPTPT